MGEGDPKTGEHPRGDNPDPRGTPQESNRQESGKPFTGREPGIGAGEHEVRNDPPGRGGGGAPSNRQMPAPKEPGDGPRHG